MTARNYTGNGFFWTGVDGYRGSYLTAYRNGDYGIYAFDSVNGQFDHSYASGSPDAGFYIGQCFPCDAVIDRRRLRVQRARATRARTPAATCSSSTRRVAQQPRRHRAQLGQLRAVLPAARDDHRRQPRVLQQPGRHAGDRRRDPGHGQRDPRRRVASATPWSTTGCGTTTRPASVSSRTSRTDPSTTSRPRTSGSGPARRRSRTRSNMEPPDIRAVEPAEQHGRRATRSSESGIADLTIALGRSPTCRRSATASPATSSRRRRRRTSRRWPRARARARATGPQAPSTWCRGSKRPRTRRSRRRTRRRRRRSSSRRRTCPTRPPHRRTPPTTS